MSTFQYCLTARAARYLGVKISVRLVEGGFRPEASSTSQSFLLLLIVVLITIVRFMAQSNPWTWMSGDEAPTPSDLPAVQPGQGKDVARTSQTGPYIPEGQRVVVRMVSSRSSSDNDASDVGGGDDVDDDVVDGGGVTYPDVTPSSAGSGLGAIGSRSVERRRDIGGSGGILSVSVPSSSGGADGSSFVGARPKERSLRLSGPDDVSGFVHLSVDDEISFRTPVDRLEQRRREEPDMMHFDDVERDDDVDDDDEDRSREDREGLKGYGGMSTATDYSSAYDGSFSDSAFVRFR